MKNKNKVIVSKADDKLNFYLLVSGKTKFYLFTQAYTKGVYQYFQNGRSEKEIRTFRRWNRNPRLDKTIEKLPLYIRYVIQYESA